MKVNHMKKNTPRIHQTNSTKTAEIQALSAPSLQGSNQSPDRTPGPAEKFSASINPEHHRLLDELDEAQRQCEALQFLIFDALATKTEGVYSDAIQAGIVDLIGRSIERERKAITAISMALVGYDRTDSGE